MRNSDPRDGARIGDQMRRDLVQRRSEIGDELQRWLADAGLVFVFVGQEPVAIVVALQASEEAEEFGSEVGGHGFRSYFT